MAKVTMSTCWSWRNTPKCLWWPLHLTYGYRVKSQISENFKLQQILQMLTVKMIFLGKWMVCWAIIIKILPAYESAQKWLCYIFEQQGQRYFIRLLELILTMLLTFVNCGHLKNFFTAPWLKNLAKYSYLLPKYSAENFTRKKNGRFLLLFHFL